MDISIVADFLRSIGEGNLVNGIAVIALVIGTVAGAWAIRQFGLHEKIAQFTKQIAVLDDYIEDLVMFIGTNFDSVDLEAAEKEAAELAEAEKPYIIDARMLYLVREVQRFAKDKWNLELDLVFIHRRAENYLQTIRRDPTNGIDI
jgi:hypothetical protein